MKRKNVNKVSKGRLTVSEGRTVLNTAAIGVAITIIVAFLGIVADLYSILSPTPTPPVGFSTHTPTPQITPLTPTPTESSAPSPWLDLLKNESVTQIFITAISALVGILVAVLITNLNFIRERKSPAIASTVTPTNRLQKLVDDLSKSSSEADKIIREITDDLKKREVALSELQSRNTELVTQEAELRRRIDLLKEMPIEVAEYFQKINEQNLKTIDKRSSRRDFQFFVLGIVVSTIIAIILRIVGLG